MNTLELLSEYRVMFLIAGIFVLAILLGILIWQIAAKTKEFMEAIKKDISKEDLQSMDFLTVDKNERASIIRKCISADGINPNPENYMIIQDGTKEVYVRSMTITHMSKRVNFATTFSRLLNFPDSTHSVFVNPLDEQSSSHKLDRHIIVLEAEYNLSKDSNRNRKLQAQYKETNEWAAEIESGKNKFFRVGFLFSIYADSIEELTKKSDAFRAIARNKGLDVSVCYGLQGEAYAANAPLGWTPNGQSPIDRNGVAYHYMDKYAVSTIFNYTTSSFSHRDGALLGRHRITGMPTLFNPFHPSFLGYTHIISGKTGTGKSALIKILSYRLSLFKYRFASLDVQARQGTGDGEFSGICRLLGGINFELKNDGKNCLNPFEVRETKKYISTGIGRGYEVRDLALSDTITNAVTWFKVIIYQQNDDAKLIETVLINSILEKTVKKAYAQYGIVDGDPDSLYDIGNVITEDGNMKQDKKLKDLPTISDFYKILLMDQKVETDVDENKMRKVIIKALETYVRDLYYTEDSLHFFTQKEYLALPVKPGTSIRIFKNTDGTTEEVHHIHGTRGYFDGQSTLRYSDDIPWVNIDCSQLTEEELKVAIPAGQNYINERIIKGNSANRSKKNRLCVIFDETHIVFKNPAARKLLENIVRTARKRMVALFLSTQTIKEFEEYSETRAIWSQAATKFIFKQDAADRNWLIQHLGLTPAQVDDIIAQGGNIDAAAGNDEDAAKESAKHRGEFTLIINKLTVPIKVDYLKQTEKHAVETAASEIIEHLETA